MRIKEMITNLGKLFIVEQILLVRTLGSVQGVSSMENMHTDVMELRVNLPY